MTTVAIVPAAGAGRRLAAGKGKAFVLLAGRPLITYCLDALERSPRIDAVLVAVERARLADIRKLIRRYGYRKVRGVVAGGRTRCGSVRNCLSMTGDGDALVLIHDAARPFLEERFIAASIAAARRHGAAIVAVPEHDTVKLADARGFVRRTLDRSRVWKAQTPQTFRRPVLVRAHGRRAPDAAVTDDALLVEGMRRPVRIVRGASTNIKVTTREDLAVAEKLARRLRRAGTVR